MCIRDRWNNVTTVPYEALGRRKKHRTKIGLRMWNDEIRAAVEDKKEAYKKFLQYKSALTEENYHQKKR